MADKSILFRTAQKVTDDISNEQRNKIVREYQKTLKEVKSEVSSLFEKYGNKDGTLPREKMQKYNRLSKFEKALNAEIGKLTRSTNQITREGITKTYMENYFRYGHMISTEAIVPLSYSSVSKNKLDAILFNELDLIKWSERNRNNNHVMARQIKEELMQGMVQGRSYGQIAKKITERTNVGANKSIRIAQTEMHRASQQGQIESMRTAESQGVSMKKRWVSTLDDRTRDEHADLDGKEFDIEEEFTNSKGDKAISPSQFGNPADDINCRCTMITVVNGISPSLRRARDSDGKNTEIENISYKEWKKKQEQK